MGEVVHAKMRRDVAIRMRLGMMTGIIPFPKFQSFFWHFGHGDDGKLLVRPDMQIGFFPNRFDVFLARDDIDVRHQSLELYGNVLESRTK